MRTFPADITADDPVVTARSKYVLLQFGSSSKNCAHLVMTMSLEAHLSQLRAATFNNSSCATTVHGMVPLRAVRLSEVTHLPTTPGPRASLKNAASDGSAVVEHTRGVVYVRDGERVVVRRDGYQIYLASEHALCGDPSLTPR